MEITKADKIMDLTLPMDIGRKSPIKSSPQTITPPASNSGSPIQEIQENNSFISLSTTFYPGSANDPLPTDAILLSPDSVFFYIQSHRILSASENGFNHLLPVDTPKKEGNDSDPIIRLPEPSAVVNILLHTIYELSCQHYCPSLQDLVAAVAALQKYGIPLETNIAPSSPLFVTLLSHASTSPLQVYALAASYGLHDLAVATSSHLLSFPLSALTDESASQIGPIYLRRLVFLHLGRIEALKRLLLPPPEMHTPTATCDLEQQKKLTRAWALAAAYLTWDAKPDMQTMTMEAALTPLGDHLSCQLCKMALVDRVKSLAVQWTTIKKTI